MLPYWWSTSNRLVLHTREVMVREKRAFVSFTGQTGVCFAGLAVGGSDRGAPIGLTDRPEGGNPATGAARPARRSRPHSPDCRIFVAHLQNCLTHHNLPC